MTQAEQFDLKFVLSKLDLILAANDRLDVNSQENVEALTTARAQAYQNEKIFS